MGNTVYNLLDIDIMVDAFLKENANGIKTLHNMYFHNNEKLSINSLIAELMNELRTGCVTFLNKEFPLEEINQYLFYIVNSYCKAKGKPLSKKKIDYLCPGCKFLDKDAILDTYNKLCICNECAINLKTSTEPKMVSLFKTFSKHNKTGYHCKECQRFIPHPLDDSNMIVCPYFDCCFVGEISHLNKMHHPSIISNAECLTLDAPQDGHFGKNNISSGELSALYQLEIEEELQGKIKIIKDIIVNQSNSVSYSSSDFTIKHKHLVYQSFNNILDKYPEEMTNYLLNNSRSGGFQHKVFQEYIRLLEASLPIVFKKNNKLYRIESLLDDNLSLFDGISTFETIVNDKLYIKNNTEEFYIGGRKASYTKPYYIGKLLNIFIKDTKTPVLDRVVEYSFSKIKMRDIDPGTEVCVTHLRVPPHYQMGGMVYINRVRKKIVDRALSIINKDNDE